ncbi:FkbM family methyltransferase [Haladaptatus sp. GCM10025707]|uniref:FkbM family methyltransferase n=1 Tax=unclassified Haladaptatus TaxID=2622732 RepID=UPI0023E75C8A|nr:MULTISPECIES: FkbM family methyltransferase [unclassified Haladaptatus]
MRAAPKGWRHRGRIGDVTAEFATTSLLEYQRVTTLFGEERIIEALLDDLDGSEIVWDVGANVGIYACFIAKKLTSGVVIGFEPEPVNETRLQRNLQANAPPERWQTAAIALSNVDGPGMLASADDRARETEAGAGHHYLSATDGWLPVACKRGETVIDEGLPAPTILKIDVQGAELQVLEGMGDALSTVERIYAELHTEKCPQRYGTSVAEVEQFLRDAGFTLENLGTPTGDRHGVYYIRASRHTPSTVS